MDCSPPAFFFVKLTDRYVRFDVADILYAETIGKGCRLYLKERSCMLPVNLKQLQSLLRDQLFFRIHRSYIVSLRYVTAFDQELVSINGVSLPMSGFYRDLMLRHVPVIAPDEELFPDHQPVRNMQL